MDRIKKVLPHFSLMIALVIGTIVGVIFTLFVHEIHYGIVREIFAAPSGKAWVSSGGKHSDQISIFFPMLLIISGSFIGLFLSHIILPKIPGLPLSMKRDDKYVYWPLIVGSLLTIGILSFLDLFGNPFFL